MWKQASRNMVTKAYGMKVMIYNTDSDYIAECFRILDKWGIQYRVTRRLTSKIGTKMITEIHTQALDSVLKVLMNIHEHLFAKQKAAIAMLGLALSRKASRDALGIRAPWTDDQIQAAKAFRRAYMPYRKRANGETLPGELEVIPCQALGSVKGTKVDVETTGMTNTTNNYLHELPATPDGVEDIVQSSEKSERGDKEPLKNIG
jgi:uncharacterized protein YqgV (UPF0045/DUF77 family)